MKKNIKWLKEELLEELMQFNDNPNMMTSYETGIADGIVTAINLTVKLDEPEVLSPDGIDKHSNGTSRSQYVWVDDLKELLVPKQEEVDRAYKDGYDKGKEHANKVIKPTIPQFAANRIEEERAKIKTFYTSDTHFNQKRTYQYSLRDQYFESVEQATEEMVRRWNSVVSAEDTVIHLGDFGDFEVAKRLNGNIILLFGNYERDGIFTPTQEEKGYFHAVLDCIGLGEDYLMVHEPENRKDAIASILKDKGVDYTDSFDLFGPIHEKQKVKRNGLNVGVDVHNFTPVSRETVEFYRIAVQNIYDDNCFENY